MPVDNDKPVRKFTSFVERMGKRLVQPQDSEANALQDKNRMIDEYQESLEGAPQSSLPAVWRSSPEDRVNGGRYGSRPGEVRINTDEMVRPLGGATSAPIKNDPNDGHHQLAVLEEGERVLTPQQNKQYEAEHSLGRIPLYDDGGDVPPDPLAVGQYADPSAANAVASASPDQQPELSTMGKIQNVAGQAQNALGKVLGKSQGGDIPEAQTRMYPIEGLTAKVFDDGGLVEKKNDEDMKGAPVDFGGRVLEQPNPPVRPMTDTEPPDTETLTGGAKPSFDNAPASTGVEVPAVREVSAMKPIVDGAKRSRAIETGDMRELSKHLMNEKLGSPQLISSTLPDVINQVDPEVKALPLQSPGLGKMGVMSPKQVMDASVPRDFVKNEREHIKSDIQNTAEGAVGRPLTPEETARIGSDEYALAKIAQYNPWGSKFNHPGTLGKIGHVLGTIGNVAGEALLPNLVAQIPGSEANRRMKEEQGLGRIKFGEDLAKTQAETREANARAATAGLKPQNFQFEKDDSGNLWRLDKTGITPPQLVTFDQQGNPQLNTPAAGMQPPSGTAPATSGQASGGPTFGVKPEQRPAPVTEVQNMQARISGMPYLSQDQKTELQFPSGYQPTVAEVKERNKTLDDLDAKQRQGKQDEFNNELRKILAQNSVLMTQMHLRDEEVKMEKVRTEAASQQDQAHLGLYAQENYDDAMKALFKEDPKQYAKDVVLMTELVNSEHSGHGPFTSVGTDSAIGAIAGPGGAAIGAVAGILANAAQPTINATLESLKKRGLSDTAYRAMQAYYNALPARMGYEITSVLGGKATAMRSSQLINKVLNTVPAPNTQPSSWNDAYKQYYNPMKVTVGRKESLLKGQLPEGYTPPTKESVYGDTTAPSTGQSTSTDDTVLNWKSKQKK